MGGRSGRGPITQLTPTLADLVRSVPPLGFNLDAGRQEYRVSRGVPDIGYRISCPWIAASIAASNAAHVLFPSFVRGLWKVERAARDWSTLASEPGPFK
jgi:hypothetical protein